MNEKRLRNVVNVHANARKDRRDVISLPQRAFGAIIISCLFVLFVFVVVLVLRFLYSFAASFTIYVSTYSAAMMICHTKKVFFCPPRRCNFM
jgi:hypothetical protein